MILVKVQSPENTAPPVFSEESLPLVVTDSQPAASNYVDCTESNDEEEEEEEEIDGRGDTKLMKERGVAKESEKNESEGNSSSNPPKWEDFFTTETLPDSQSSLNSQSCCSIPSSSLSRMTGSQTPELFSDEEETPNDDQTFSLTLSASLSNHSSQNQDSDVADTLILRPEKVVLEQGDLRTGTVSQEKRSNDQDVQPGLEELSDSQASSDFDIPATPDSKMPRPDELLQLYRKLAAGEDVIVRRRL